MHKCDQWGATVRSARTTLGKNSLCRLLANYKDLVCSLQGLLVPLCPSFRMATRGMVETWATLPPQGLGVHVCKIRPELIHQEAALTPPALPALLFEFSVVHTSSLPPTATARVPPPQEHQPLPSIFCAPGILWLNFAKQWKRTHGYKPVPGCRTYVQSPGVGCLQLDALSLNRECMVEKWEQPTHGTLYLEKKNEIRWRKISSKMPSSQILFSGVLMLFK